MRVGFGNVDSVLDIVSTGCNMHERPLSIRGLLSVPLYTRHKVQKEGMCQANWAV